MIKIYLKSYTFNWEQYTTLTEFIHFVPPPNDELMYISVLA